jgi:hypothetical protein
MKKYFAKLLNTLNNPDKAQRKKNHNCAKVSSSCILTRRSFLGFKFDWYRINNANDVSFFLQVSQLGSVRKSFEWGRNPISAGLVDE